MRDTASIPFLLLLIFLCSLFQSCTKQDDTEPPSKGAWQKIADFPGSARFRAVSFAIGDNVYAGMGRGDDANGNYGLLDDFYAYNTVSKTWKRAAPFPLKGDANAITFTVNGKAYLVQDQEDTCRCHGTVGVKVFWEFDPDKNTWKTVSVAPQAEGMVTAVFVTTGKIYLLLFPYKLIEFNPATYLILEKAACPVFTTAPAFFSLNNKGYLLSDADSIGQPNEVNAFLEYDPSADRWTHKADFPGKPRQFAMSFSVKGNGYIGCGSVFKKLSTFILTQVDARDFWKYNPASDAWTQVADYPGRGTYDMVARVANDNAFMGTGTSLNSSDPDSLPPYKDFWQFVP